MRSRILFLFFMSLFLSDQNFSYSQHPWCRTPDYTRPVMSYERVREIRRSRSSMSDYAVNVMVHVLRSDEGAWGPSQQEVLSELDTMQAQFAPTGICFAFLGINEIWNTDYVENWVDDHHAIAVEIIGMYGSPTRMDIFLVPDEVMLYSGGEPFAAGSFSIPSHYIGIQEAWLAINGAYGNVTLSHEMGHGLGLYHTFSGYDSYISTEPGSIDTICHPALERVDGSNGETAGDYIPDTNADPTVNWDANGDPNGCTPAGPPEDCNGDSFSPPYENIMSYARYCQFEFSPDQIDRMHAELDSGAVGSLMRAPASVQLQTTVLSSGISFITSSTFINHPLNVIYQLSGSNLTKHVASTAITLRPGFWADPASGRYEAYISPLCE